VTRIVKVCIASSCLLLLLTSCRPSSTQPRCGKSTSFPCPLDSLIRYRPSRTSLTMRGTRELYC
jgi:hypothetical protein